MEARAMEFLLRACQFALAAAVIGGLYLLGAVISQRAKRNEEEEARRKWGKP